MSTSSESIENISDTARLVAVYRAMETERPDALFQDLFARSLAGERGEQIARVMGNKPSDARYVVIRTCVIDELIKQSVFNAGVDTVLNLGAGLDSRPYRLPLPSSLKWIEVDLTDIISYKQQKLAHEQPVCSLELVKLDLTDISARNLLFSQVRAAAQKVLVLTEGLLYYLSAEQVASLATDLHAQPNFSGWLFDIISPFILKQVQKKWGKYLAAGNSSMQFAPDEGMEFFKQYGWKVAESRSLWEEARRLKREFKYTWLLALLVRLSTKERWETFSKRDGIVFLKRA